jgi:hypothetical protein
MGFMAGDSTGERQREDYYKTPEHATVALLKREQFSGWIWECACGDGAISKAILNSDPYNQSRVMSTDVFDRGYGETGVDFLHTHRAVDHIITNPPYRLAEEFVLHALECARDRVAMLLKLNFLESKGRKEFFQRTPLRTVYVFSNRLSFDKGDEKGKDRGLLAYAWFIWEKNYHGKPWIDWI